MYTYVCIYPQYTYVSLSLSIYIYIYMYIYIFVCAIYTATLDASAHLQPRLLCRLFAAAAAAVVVGIVDHEASANS